MSEVWISFYAKVLVSSGPEHEKTLNLDTDASVDFAAVRRSTLTRTGLSPIRFL